MIEFGTLDLREIKLNKDLLIAVAKTAFSAWATYGSMTLTGRCTDSL